MFPGPLSINASPIPHASHPHPHPHLKSSAHRLETSRLGAVEVVSLGEDGGKDSDMKLKLWIDKTPVGMSVERKTVSLQDWGPADGLQIEQTLGSRGLVRGGKPGTCSVMEARGSSGVSFRIKCSELLRIKDGAGV